MTSFKQDIRSIFANHSVTIVIFFYLGEYYCHWGKTLKSSHLKRGTVSLGSWSQSSPITGSVVFRTTERASWQLDCVGGECSQPCGQERERGRRTQAERDRDRDMLGSITTSRSCSYVFKSDPTYEDSNTSQFYHRMVTRHLAHDLWDRGQI